MPSFLHLPPEVLANVLAWLDPQSVIRCQRLSKNLRPIAQSDHVLRLVCIRAGYLGNAHQDLESLERPLAADSQHGPIHDYATQPAYKFAGRPESDFESYPKLLSSSYILDKIKDKPSLRFDNTLHYSPLFPCDIWRAHIDHIENFIIAIGADDYGTDGLLVYDMEAERQVFGVPPHLAPPRTHLEASQGWFVHTQRSTWNASADQSHNTFQFWCWERLTDKENPTKGHLANQGNIHSPHIVHSYRFKFPHLLVASAHHIIMYNAITKEEEMTIPTFDFEENRLVNAIDFDEDYIWITSRHKPTRSELRAYCRHTQQLKQTLQSGQMAIRHSEVWLYSIPAPKLPNKRGVRTARFKRYRESFMGPATQYFNAVHMDSKTGCLCILGGSTLFLIPNYKRQSKILPDVKVIALSDDNDQPVLSKYNPYLAVCEGRAAFFTEGGVAMVNLVDVTSNDRKRNPTPIMPVFCFKTLFNIGTSYADCIALTPTTLLIASVEVDDDEAELVNLENPYHRDSDMGPLWVDFLQMTEKDVSKWRKMLLKDLASKQIASREAKKADIRQARGSDPISLSHDFVSKPPHHSRSGEPPQAGNTSIFPSEEYYADMLEEGIGDFGQEEVVQIQLIIG
ncbi:unnamed protein product [Sympodiomycopsis kandeliae]